MRIYIYILIYLDYNLLNLNLFTITSNMTSKYSGATKAFDVCLFTGYYGIKMAAQLGFVLVYQAGWVGGYFWRVIAVVVAKGFRCVFPKKMMYSHVYMHI